MASLSKVEIRHREVQKALSLARELHRAEIELLEFTYSLGRPVEIDKTVESLKEIKVLIEMTKMFTKESCDDSTSTAS